MLASHLLRHARMEFGYWLASEEHDPRALVRNAQRAEQIGLSFVMISDHYHPWIGRQGQSPFVWSVIGGIAATTKLRVLTAVTAPIIRMHPAIVAQAAATSGAMLEGRFLLGLDTGENLNEHVVGQGWPMYETRLEMLGEAIVIMRELFTWRQVSFRGTYYTVEDARLYTHPDHPVPILIAASGEKTAKFAAEHGDGLVTVGPNKEPVAAFDAAGGNHKPRYAQLHLCWGSDAKQAQRLVHELWPLSGIPTPADLNVKTPREFEALAKLVRAEDVAKKFPHGPDLATYVKQAKQFVEAGIDHVAFHQVGPDQEGFFRFYERELRPALEKEVSHGRAQNEAA